LVNNCGWKGDFNRDGQTGSVTIQDFNYLTAELASWEIDKSNKFQFNDGGSVSAQVSWDSKNNQVVVWGVGALVQQNASVDYTSYDLTISAQRYRVVFSTVENISKEYAGSYNPNA
jgi:hypothetical protein